MPSLRMSRITIGRNIRLRRKDLGLSQTALAEVIGCNRKMVGQIENGRTSLPLESAPAVVEMLQFKRLDDLFSQLWE
jgi:transcriptional regulator with XRE-family HTH domain